MNVTPDEARALAFIGGLVFLSVVVRVADRPRPVTADLPGVDLAALEAATRTELEASRTVPRPLAEGERIDPNRATAAELMRLPRARRSVVDRIVAARAQGTRFETLADLDRVPGVGVVTIEAWRGHLTLRGAGDGVARGDAVDGRGTAAASASRDVGSASPRERVDLNRATAAELERLPGVGPALAVRIIAYRDSVGSFGSVDQLERVKGIGPATVARLRELVKAGT
jgi:competence protein ComEA